MSEGLHVLGISHRISASRERESDVAILLGTTCWRSIESSGKYLLVDRCSFNDTNKYVSLVWDGHGRRGDHKVPAKANGARWKQHGVEVHPLRRRVGHIVLCGQTESYSPDWPSMPEFYRKFEHLCTHFRSHPAQPVNPTLLPEWNSFEDCRQFITLNSSVAVDAILRGIPTDVMDPGGMAYPGAVVGSDLKDWLHWLAWTQWSHSEIAEGIPIKHLFNDM